MKKILVFLDKNFPGFKTEFAFNDNRYAVCKAEDLKEELSKEYEAFINLHGGYFPTEAFENIIKFLEKGKGFLNIYDTPFTKPCTKDNGAWIVGKEKMSYYRKLNIHSVLNVDSKDIVKYVEYSNIDICNKLIKFFPIMDVKNFIMIPTKNKYVEKEWGSVGSMDAKITSLVKGLDENSEHYSSPVVLIENRAGRYKAGRWVFINQDINVDNKVEFVEALENVVNYISNGYREILVKPSFPLYYEGEKASVKIQIENFIKESIWNLEIKVFDKNGIIFNQNLELDGKKYSSSEIVSIDKELKSGSYKIEVNAKSSDGEKQIITQGFCVKDSELLKRREKITCGKDYFIIDGKHTPVIGTTYMSGEYSRAFLQVPNTNLWLEDMKDMRKEGINWIRTGMWCNWRNFMLDDSHFDEHILRAIDAFIQCAAEVNLHVTFTFFTFVPEPWEGTHPYLDRRSLDAQRRFISNVVIRHKDTTNVDWDLINEPFTYDHPSQTKTKDDTCEDKAFQEYMKKHYKSINDLNEKLDLTIVDNGDFNNLKLPTRENINFDITDMGDSKNGLIWQDYIKFTVDMFSNWTKEMRDVIKDINSKHLVTVGQDEALRGQRPTPLLYGELLDYNSQHTWWLLDDLVWDTIFTKYFNKPLLVQETGIMYSEKPNCKPRRDENDIANLLQKKYAYAFGTRCAGAIQWIWNTNYFLKSANESNIGAKRCDGSKKPEMKISKAFSKMFNEGKHLIGDVINDNEIAVIFPFTNDFSNRNFAQHATTQITKVLTYNMKKQFIGVSEFDLSPIRESKPKVIFVPSPHHYNDEKFKELLDLVSEIGGTIVFTGPISLNEYFDDTNRASNLLGKTKVVPMARYEVININGNEYEFSFDNTYVSKAFKEVDEENNLYKEVKLGNGKLIWIGIPIEISSENYNLEKIYSEILEKECVKEKFKVISGGNKGIFISKVNWEKGALYTLVNELNVDTNIEILDLEVNKNYKLDISGDGSELFIIDNLGKIVSVYNDKSVLSN